MAEVVDPTEIKCNEHAFLLRVGGMLDRAKSSLDENKFGIAQGALRAFFNGVGGLVADSDYLSTARKSLLNELSDKIFHIRDDLVIGVEVDKKSLAEVVASSKAYARLEEAKITFEGYLIEWYGPSKA
jgi:hypothetical protein